MSVVTACQSMWRLLSCFNICRVKCARDVTTVKCVVAVQLKGALDHL